MGDIQRRRVPAGERQVRVSLTPAGRKLSLEGIGSELFEAIGLGDDFAKVLKAVVKLRDNLPRAT